MGTGSIKGFGVALTIGVAASLFTSLVVTRMIFDWLLDRGWLKSVKMLHFDPRDDETRFHEARQGGVCNLLAAHRHRRWLRHLPSAYQQPLLGPDFVGGGHLHLRVPAKGAGGRKRGARCGSTRPGSAIRSFSTKRAPTGFGGGKETLRVVSQAGAATRSKDFRPNSRARIST